MDDDINDALATIVAGKANADELESDTLDFKEDRGDIAKDVAEAAICFANPRAHLS